MTAPKCRSILPALIFTRNSTLSISTQVYKWVPANCWGILTGKPGGTLHWTIIPPRGSSDAPSRFMLWKPKLRTGLTSLMACSIQWIGHKTYYNLFSYFMSKVIAEYSSATVQSFSTYRIFRFIFFASLAIHFMYCKFIFSFLFSRFFSFPKFTIRALRLRKMFQIYYYYYYYY